ALGRVGDEVRYQGFIGAFDRAGQTMKETSHGGKLSLISLRNDRATIDWAPDPADLDLTQLGPQGQPLNLQGTEHWAFRLEIDSRSGALVRARTTYDDLDLT